MLPEVFSYFSSVLGRLGTLALAEQHCAETFLKMVRWSNFQMVKKVPVVLKKVIAETFLNKLESIKRKLLYK